MAISCVAAYVEATVYAACVSSSTPRFSRTVKVPLTATSVVASMVSNLDEFAGVASEEIANTKPEGC